MGAPQLSGPAWINTTIVPQFVNQMAANLMVKRGSVLYIWQNFPFGSPTTATHTAVFKSIDDGTTWTALDFANSPNATGSPYYDAANNRWIGAMVFTPTPNTDQPLFLQNFDFVTETWGAAYNTGGPNAGGLVYAMLVRPDGTFVVSYKINSPTLAGHSLLKASIVPAALNSWGSVIDLGVAIVPFISNGNVLGCGLAVDSSGNTHAFFQDSNKTHFIYQQLLANNTLGPSFHWAAATLSTPTSNFWQPIIFGGSLLCPFVAGSFLQNSYVLGTPLSSPVFSIQTPAGVQRSGQSGGNSPMQTDGTTIFWCVNWAPSFQFTKYQVFTSTDGLAWTLFPNNSTSPYFYDFAVSPTPPNIDATDDQIYSPFILFPNAVGSLSKGYLFVVTQNLSTGASQTAFLNAILFGSAPPPASQIFSLSLFGWKLFKKAPCDTSPVEVPECPDVEMAR